ncbi:MAG: peptidase MA family metallohydrolase [Dehalococcoidia bacterium]
MPQDFAGARAVRGLALAAIVLVGAISIALVHPAPAAAAPAATNAAVDMPDPATLTFRAHLTADADLASATVNYKVLSPDVNIGGSLRAEVSGSRSTDVSVTLPMNNNDRYIPVGTQITYSWSVADKNGATATSAEQTITFLDGRYQWQSKTAGQVTVYWYGNAEANADLALKAAAASIADNEALLKVKLGYPVRVLVWRNTNDSKAAQRPRASTFDQQVITGGSRVAADVLHIYDPLGGFEDVARHEMAHVITKIAGDGKVSPLPSWIDEGTAVYAQTSPGGYEPALKRAIATDSVMRLRNMAAPTNTPAQVDIFYGQSWAVVKFMVDTYGRDKFAAVFAAVKSGAPIDDALQQHIGVDQDGLYNAWRKSVGLKTIDFPPVPKSTAVAGAQATQPPLGIPTSVKSDDAVPSGGGGEGTAAVAGVPKQTAIIVGVLALVVAAAIGAAALRVARQR